MAITDEVPYAAGGHSGKLVTITAEVHWVRSFHMPLEVIQEG